MKKQKINDTAQERHVPPSKDNADDIHPKKWMGGMQDILSSRKLSQKLLHDQDPC